MWGTQTHVHTGTLAEPGVRGSQLQRQSAIPERVMQFAKFCIVGGSGVIVDMAVLYALADPKTLALNVTLSKVLAAEVAMTSNFVWNELWTFRQTSGIGVDHQGWFQRLLKFNAICAIGIGLAVLLLHLFHTLLGWNLYVSNLLAIVLITGWNFGMNARFNWPKDRNVTNARDVGGIV